ncbi:unnamed protein product [Clonostachys rhizophaga]|uniref:Helicase C-terminal domain-containing protein n=1 Tax=Clonostachys rhizophaga TaxID=160324 RepID=A0A9N9YJN1_9HYPO|nr:unnamed protein product [Clonostachys rhizophaga]
MNSIQRTQANAAAGEVPPNERARRLEKINTQGVTSILLLTSGTGGTGLNVTGVSHVLLTEPQWNLGLEVQIIGRSYGLGQKHQVRVSKLFCEKSSIDNLVEQIKQYKTSTARTIIITSPGTFYGCLFTKKYHPIVFTDTDGDIDIGDDHDDPADEDMLIVENGITVKLSDASE